MTLKYAAERMTGQAVEVNTGALSEQLTKYASILAAQGALSAALTYPLGGRLYRIQVYI